MSGVRTTETIAGGTSVAARSADEAAGPDRPARTFRGVAGAPGRAVGPVARLLRQQSTPSDEPFTGDVAGEIRRLEEAIARVVADLEARAAHPSTEETAAEILEATAMMAGDPSLLTAARDHVADDRCSAPRAIWLAMGRFRDSLAAAGGYLAARTSDLDDVRDRVVAELDGRGTEGIGAGWDSPRVLVARDLAPVDTAGLDPSAVLAIVIEQGGPTSHTAILACALGIPAVVACQGALELADGMVVAVDGDTGVVEQRPAGTQSARASRTVLRVGGAGGRMKDGTAVALLANVGDAAGVSTALDNGAEGVGLFRTELAFLHRDDRPSVAEQRAVYAEVFTRARGRKVVVRTLDAGADKPLPFLRIPPEENPALGVRGLRVASIVEDLLEDQLRAIALAAADADAQPWVMAPMVATCAEARGFVAMAGEFGLPIAGAMIEVPAAALNAGHLLAEVEFVSIGTNDLGQYTMAADRNNARLAALNDPWQPALLALIDMVARAGVATGTPVGVCGEAAGDPRLAVVLAGLGVTSLSMTPRRLGAVAERLAGVDSVAAAELARAVLATASAEDARALALAALPD